MVELDSRLMGAEIETLGLLAVQVVIALTTLGVGLWGNDRVNRIALPFLLLLAVAACGTTLYRLEMSEDLVRGRLEGRIPGQFLPQERGENHLAWLGRQRLYSIGLAVVTISGGLRSYLRRLRKNPASSSTQNECKKTE